MAEAAGFMDYTEYEFLSDRFVRLPRKTAIVCTSGHEPFLMTAADFEIQQFDANPESIEDEISETEDLDNDENIFLESIVKESFLSVTERRLKLGWRNEKYVRIVDCLLQKRKIERVKVKLGKGSPKILYQTPGRVPSVKHEFYVNWISDYLKSRGFICKKNSEGPDIEIPEIKTVIEVELGKSNMYGNIRNDSQKFDRVIICSDQKRVLEVLSNEIKDPKILFCQIQNFPAFFEKKTARNDLEDI